LDDRARQLRFAAQHDADDRRFRGLSEEDDERRR
jgi:hypothetical protein